MDPAPLFRPLPLIVGALAVARLTRLVTDDTITEPLRQRVVARWPGAGDFVVCPWCVSTWLAAGWAGAVTVAPRSAGVLGAILAWSEVASLADSVA